MPRAGFTNAPCHGCGSIALHRKNSVCDTCRGQLTTYASIVQKQAESSESRVFAMVERSYAIPYMSYENEGNNGNQDRVRGPLLDLSMLLSEPTRAHVTTYQDGIGHIDDAYLWVYEKNRQRHEWIVHRSMNPVVASVLRKLQVGVRDALAAAHKSGAREGRNLLMSLADGSITNDEFNTRAARLDGEPER